MIAKKLIREILINASDSNPAAEYPFYRVRLCTTTTDHNAGEKIQEVRRWTNEKGKAVLEFRSGTKATIKTVTDLIIELSKDPEAKVFVDLNAVKSITVINADNVITLDD